MMVEEVGRTGSGFCPVTSFGISLLNRPVVLLTGTSQLVPVTCSAAQGFTVSVGVVLF
jgi:hypothetical protein